MRLLGKVAIVTGGGRGNGRAIALGYAREGADVVIADISLETARATAEEIRALGRRSSALAVDVTDAASVGGMVDRAWAEMGQVDILVNNAGVIGRLPFMEVDEAEWERVMGVNLKGPFLCGQAMAKKMIAAGRGGVIINITSVMTEATTPTTVPYCTSKGGVRTLTKGMAVALAPHKIRVVAIAPCIIWTDMSDALLSNDTIRQNILRRIPLGEIAKSEVLVGAAVFLASDEASYITGSTVTVDGGMLAV